jgi:amino acid permease
MSNSAKNFFYAISMLSGMIIGVGLFALPYIASQVGVWIMLGYLFVLTILVMIIHRLFGEVALNTPDFLRLPSYAGIHLGKWGKRIALLTTITGFLGTILAYIIIGGGFLHDFLAPALGGSIFLYTFIYFALGAFLIFWGIRAISKIEFLDVVLFAVILAAICWSGFRYISPANLATAVNPRNWFLPYGAILFSLWGASLIPEVEEMLGKRKDLLKKTINFSVLIPAIFYLLFILAVVSISGSLTSPEAIIGLKNFLGGRVISLLLIFGLMATFTSYVALGLTLRKIFSYDFKIPRNISWAIACFTPFILYLVGFKNFINIIGFVGAIALAIEGILIVLMYNKIKQRWLLTLPLILVLLAGIVYEIIYFVNF